MSTYDCPVTLGVAKCEDTITLTVVWENIDGSSSTGALTQNCSWSQIKFPSSTVTGVYTSSWIAPKGDVHSQQRFFYMGQVNRRW
jgi:D-galacturonate reductase